MTDIPAAPVLPNRLLQNARVLSSRLDILPFLPVGGVFCEVGVAYGDFTAEILRVCRPRAFIAIDIFTIEQLPTMWGYERLGGRGHEEFFRNRFRLEIASGRMRVMRGYSSAELPKLEDRSVEVFYLDAWHSHDSVLGELNVIKDKVTEDGWILLNDYTMYDFYTNSPYGVIHAAHEFMIKEGWEMRFLALQPQMFCDIAIRKIREW